MQQNESEFDAERDSAGRQVFSDSDHLTLLQLMTRRAMASRFDRQSETAALEGRAGVGEAADLAPRPGRWQLVPGNLKLHQWQSECLPIWLEKGRGTVKVATGGGKTVFALKAAETLQNTVAPDLRLVIVVPTIPLMYQWRDELRLSNLPANEIGMMGGGNDPFSQSDPLVLICVLNSARDRLVGFVKKAGWRGDVMLVVDECHRANAQQSRKVFDIKARYTLGLSATPEVDGEDESIPPDDAYEQSPVGKGLGPIIFEFTLKQSAEAGLLTPFEVLHVGLPLQGEERARYEKLSREISDLRKALQRRHQASRSRQGFLAWCQTQASRGGTAARDAERFIGLANQRKRLTYRASSRVAATIGALTDAMGDPESRVIVFHESIDEIELLYLRALEMKLPAVLEHSKLPDGLRSESIEAFRRGVARVIVSVKSLVEGFNVPSADLGIIAASSGSVRQRIQSLGRLLRRKPGGRSASVLVFYVTDTEDEAIYERADWENVVGAERNRYFVWPAEQGDVGWPDVLRETGEPPRNFRPSSWDVDVSKLALGDPYPGRGEGIELKVDHSGNLRAEAGGLVRASTDLITAIVDHNPHRRAVRTPAGHLIVRSDAAGAKRAVWKFLGKVDEPQSAADGKVRLRLKRVSGRRVISLSESGKRGAERFALDSGGGASHEAADAREKLLSWVAEIESERNLVVRDLFWDGDSAYWLEVGGERISYAAPLPRLEFKS